MDIQGIIDWEDTLIGDPFFDMAMFASFYRMHEFLVTFCEGYQEERNIQEELFFLNFWMYYLRIVIAKGVLRYKLGYDGQGMSLATPKIKMAIQELKKI